MAIINPFKVAGFESYVALKLKKMAYVSFSGGNEGYLRRELIYKVINSCFRENLEQIYF